MIRKTAVFAVAVFATACSEAKKEEAPAAAPAPQEYALHAVEYAYHGADTIPAGLTKVTTMNGGKELHHTQFVRLDSGKTVADLTEAMKKPGPFPAWAVLMPGPNASDPGLAANATVDLAAGNYAIICLVDIPGGVPHMAKGMVKSLTVTPATTPAAAAPAPTITVAMADYSFTPDKPFTAGKHVIKVTSSGPQPHEVELIKFQPGKTMEDLGKWMAKPEGPPPGSAVGGTSAQMPGATAIFDVELTPGDYALVCFVPDAKDGKIHLEKGMMLPFKIQ
jgi:uncharacterized cupredoxin-like copper-binding protein